MRSYQIDGNFRKRYAPSFRKVCWVIVVAILGTDLASFLGSFVVFAVFYIRNVCISKKSMQGCRGVLGSRWLWY